VTPPVRAHGLVHDYGHGPVLDLPELELAAGRYHLAGPNGAGKTTLLRILATLERPTRGDTRVLGHLTRRDPRAVRRRVGYAGHAPHLHGALEARDALRLHADLHGVDRGRVDAALDAWSLVGHADRRVEALSRGQARRLDLARALLHEPPVVLLDEPTTGLDDAGRTRLADALDEADPQLVLAADPRDPGLPVDGTVRLREGRLEGDPA
jgi:ABC-type multidrug transport system ATPase subunit